MNNNEAVAMFRATYKRLGMTQEEFGKKIGYKLVTINNWAGNRQDIPKHIILILELLIKEEKYEKMKAMFLEVDKQKQIIE